ncbi:glycine-rich cell wall structural protein 1.0-like [Stylophora pistillata]|uniref:glycine-rich cell wall structural protein 1.0-like n=1 Tax=Stylophora pistillata TaxID=50429 RepID=UPI000C04E7C7|nr:glycine-rich cell wall structural protein 1.0-like [Stylophora pistillata]
MNAYFRPHSLQGPVKDFTANFTNLGASGRLGPSSIGNHYKGQGHDGHVTLVAGIQQWRLPCNTRYRIEAVGATGGYDTTNAGRYRGFGARIIGTFQLKKEETLKILVGQEGGLNSASSSSGGGGGSFVVRSDNTPLIIAGGGGGRESPQSSKTECHATTSTSGNPGYSNGSPTWSGGSNGTGANTADHGNSGGGGGGFLTSGRSSVNFGGSYGNGGEGGKGFLQGGEGGRAMSNNAHGGFGGGGGAYGNGGGAGGGGGYSGGASGDNDSNSCGGGGGS